MLQHRQRLLGVASSSALIGLLLGVVPSSALAAPRSFESSSPGHQQQVEFTEVFTESNGAASSNATSTRASNSLRIQVWRSKKSKRAFVRLLGVTDSVAGREFTRVRSKNRSTSKTVTSKIVFKRTPSKTVALRSKTFKISVNAPNRVPMTVAVPKRKFRYTKAFQSIYAAASSHSQDYLLLGPAGMRHETCGYESQGVNPNIFVTTVAPSNVIYFDGNIPAAALAPIAYAIGQVERATGFRFVRGPKREGTSFVAFDVKTSSTVGASGNAGAIMYPTVKGGSVITSGFVNLTLGLRTSLNTLKRVSMHELGHAMGLGHAKHSSQVMYPVASDSTLEWGAGDQAGLTQLNYRGCRLAVGDVADYTFFR